ncbi:MAG: carboxypeptidase regulatory-like domain-containing protein [Ignavibacteriales bacterium]|nr:carboxypeptidase regulatory-like domain-containing protein [Ignavibacteriales bacterium]
MNKNIFTILLLLTFTGKFFAQPDIKIEPRNIKFEDLFSRFDYTLLYNDGDQVLYIDSLSATKPYYILEFEDNQQLPIALNPNDTVRLNITLTNFYSITVNDTTDTVWVYSNDPESPRDLRIKIDFFNDDLGDCIGLIADESANPIANSKVYFFYYGIYLFDSTLTDNAGIYTKQLPTGNYTVAAEKDGYKVMFSGNTPDPFYAIPVDLDSGQTLNVDITLPLINNNGYSVSGTVIDSIYGIPIDKGVVIIRKGTHTPTLMKPTAPNADSSVYAGFIRPDGTFNVQVEDSNYYFVQGYSEYYLPTYYNVENASSVFWQNADSVFINQSIPDKNLYIKRDSSYGGGYAYGYVTIPNIDGSSNDGVSLFAQSTTNNELYAYNFAKETGFYGINNLPYGTYKVVAQKIGFQNTYSQEFTISATNPDQRDVYLTFLPSGVDDDKEIVPTSIKLFNNFPNPFNPSTKIRFAIPSNNENSFNVKVIIYDILGNEIATLVNEEKSAGIYEVTFNANNLASGIYIVTLKASSISVSQKIILMK